MVLRIFKMIATSDQWLSDNFGVHQIRFRPGLHPGPTGGAYSAPPDHLAGLMALRLRDRGVEEEGKGGRGMRRERGEKVDRRDRPPFQKFLDPPLLHTIYTGLTLAIFCLSEAELGLCMGLKGTAA